MCVRLRGYYLFRCTYTFTLTNSKQRAHHTAQGNARNVCQKASCFLDFQYKDILARVMLADDITNVTHTFRRLRHMLVWVTRPTNRSKSKSFCFLSLCTIYGFLFRYYACNAIFGWQTATPWVSPTHVC